VRLESNVLDTYFSSCLTEKLLKTTTFHSLLLHCSKKLWKSLVLSAESRSKF
jgi:hypothetical protein